MKNRFLYFFLAILIIVQLACGGSSSGSNEPNIPSGSFVIEAGSGSETLLSRNNDTGKTISDKTGAFPVFFSTNKVKNNINDAKNRAYSDAQAFILESPHWTNLSGQTIALSHMVLGVYGDTMQSLGYTPGQPTIISVEQMIDLVNSGQINPDMCNPTQCNSGNLFYIATYSHYAGKGVLDNSSVNTNPTSYATQMTNNLMSHITIASSTDADAIDEFTNNTNDYNSIWTYEADVANINSQRVSQGLEPIYVIYVDGSIDAAQTLYFSPYYVPTSSESDSTSSDYNPQFVDQYKKLMDKFKKVSTAFEKDPDVANAIAQSGWRPVQYKAQPSQEVLRPEWGFLLDPQISTTFAPKYEVAMALNTIYVVNRKPTILVYINDDSGSMSPSFSTPNGRDQLIYASNFIFGSDAETEFLQAIPEDITKVYMFDTNCVALDTVYGTETSILANEIQNTYLGGNTSMFRCGVDGLTYLSQYKDQCNSTYNCALIFMTDGGDNDCPSGIDTPECVSVDDFNHAVTTLGLERVSIHAIPIGSADLSQINQINNVKVCKDAMQNSNAMIDCFKKIKGIN